MKILVIDIVCQLPSSSLSGVVSHFPKSRLLYYDSSQHAAGTMTSSTKLEIPSCRIIMGILMFYFVLHFSVQQTCHLYKPLPCCRPCVVVVDTCCIWSTEWLVMWCWFRLPTPPLCTVVVWGHEFVWEWMTELKEYCQSSGFGQQSRF